MREANLDRHNLVFFHVELRKMRETDDICCQGLERENMDRLHTELFEVVNVLSTTITHAIIYMSNHGGMS